MASNLEQLDTTIPPLSPDELERFKRCEPHAAVGYEAGKITAAAARRAIQIHADWEEHPQRMRRRLRRSEEWIGTFDRARVRRLIARCGRTPLPMLRAISRCRQRRQALQCSLVDWRPQRRIRRARSGSGSARSPGGGSDEGGDAGPLNNPSRSTSARSARSSPPSPLSPPLEAAR